MMQAQPERDTRIDVLRALALLTIYIDHVPGTLFEHLTYKNFGFSDAAEAFVLISGISVALAYGTKFQPGGRLLTTLKMWRRASVLYAAHIVTTMVALAIFCGRRSLCQAARPAAADQHRAGDQQTGRGADRHRHARPSDRLQQHIVGLRGAAFAGAGFPAARQLQAVAGARALGALWLAAGLFQIAPPNYPEPGFWFINPLSWQFLFNIGMVGMIHVRRGGSIPFNRWLVGGAALFVVASLIWVHSPLWGRTRGSACRSC